MDNITTITDPTGVESVIITHDDGSFTSMLKSTYDAIQASSTLAANSAPQANSTES